MASLSVHAHGPWPAQTAVLQPSDSSVSWRGGLSTQHRSTGPFQRSRRRFCTCALNRATALLPVQAAVVPLLVSAANVSGVQWDMVDGSSLATERTSSFQVCHVLRHQTESVLLLVTCQLHTESCRWRTLQACSMHT